MSSPSTRITSIRAATCTPNEYSQFPSLPGTCILVFETGSVQISRVCNRVLQKSGGLTAASRQRQFDLGGSVWSSSDLAQVPHVRARRRRRSTFLGPGGGSSELLDPALFFANRCQGPWRSPRRGSRSQATHQFDQGTVKEPPACMFPADDPCLRLASSRRGPN